MLSNLSNNNSGNATKSVVERKHYEEIEDRLNELQDEIDSNTELINQNAQDISGLDERIDAVEDNSTFPTLNTDVINPATGDKIDVSSDLDVDGNITAESANFGELSVNGTSFTTVKNDAAQAKTTAENAKNKADEAYDLADAVADELGTYKADNEQSITTGTLDADSADIGSIAAQTINTNDFETTNAVVDKLYVDTIKATGFLELPTVGQSYYTITVPAKTTASFSGIYVASNDTEYPYYFTVSDGAVIYKQNSTEIIKDISFDRETGNTKVRVKSSTNLTYISSALDNNPVTIEDGGNAYTDYAFIPQKTGGYLIRGYDDTTTEIYIAGVLRAYAMSVEEEIIERTSVDFLKVNASIELPKDWDAGGTISYSTGEENQYISAQTKAGVTKPTWTSPIHSTIGSLSYSSKLVDEATVASYKGISETRQTQTVSITNEASLQQLTAFHWTKNGNYWQPYELTRITIGDQTMWIDPTEANQGIRFSDNQVIADGTWNDVPVEEANAVPVNLVIFDAPSELSFPITNLGDKTTVHGEITATCFKGDVLGNVTGNADTATNATCFDNKTYAEAKTDILSGCAADSNKFNGKTYSEACADILSGNAATATNATCFDGKTYAEAKADILSGNAASATNATCFDNKTYAEAKADILSGCAASADNATYFDGHTYANAKADILSGNAASATNATCFDGKTYAEAKADILSGCAANADNATCFNGCTYACAKADILSGTAAQAHCVDIDSLTANSYPLVMESTTCELGKSGTCPITFTPSTGILETNQVSSSCIENSGTIQSQCLCATCDLNVDGNAYITGDLTVQGTITTTHSEEVVTPSENIILRDGATTPIASGCYSGFTVTNYDGQDNNLEVGADKDGTLHVGVAGGTMEPIATRATEACMENGYAAHWDSTGTDLVTKGATNTHDLNVNGNASVTGILTADLNGTAKNATCFGGCTYSQAKTDILSGCAANANNATCFGGCTYSQAKNDILSGNAATATNATCFNGCTYAQAKSDILSGNAASATNSTCFGGYTYAQAKADILTGNAATATNSTCFGGCTYAQAKADILSGCAADSAKLGNKLPSCYIDTSSTAQTKAGNLSIGAPAACTTTSAGGNGLLMCSLGTIELYKEGTPYIDFHYDRYCGDYSSRICSSYTSSNCRGSLDITVNNGTGCTTSTECSVYCFESDGTFTGAGIICASANIYSAGCPVVTTGTLPTVAPGYNCTGTSNYVVTTMVCCAKSVCRNQATTGTCHLALFSDKTAIANADMYVSNACELTYNPATGDLNASGKICAANGFTSDDSGVVARFEKNNEFNIYPIFGNTAFINYRGGAFYTVIGGGNGERDCCGTLIADTVCANCFDGSINMNCVADATSTNVAANSITRKTILRNQITNVGYITSAAIGLCRGTTGFGQAVLSVSLNDAATAWKDYCFNNTGRISANGLTLHNNGGINTGVSLKVGTASTDADRNIMFTPAVPGSDNTSTGEVQTSTGCPLTFNPATGVLTATCLCGTDQYHHTFAQPGNQTVYARIDLIEAAVDASTITGTLYDRQFSIQVYEIGSSDFSILSFTSSGVYNNLRVAKEGTNTIWLSYNGWRPVEIQSNTKFTPYELTTTAPSGVTWLSPSVPTIECAINATCFNGCTYAQAKADIAGSVETTPYTCINDVNSGAQDILMTSSTGTIGIVNASTGTNACPLKYNPATGELSTSCVKVGHSIIKGCCTDTTPATMCIANYCFSVTGTANLLNINQVSVAIGAESCAQLGMYGSIAIGRSAHACNDTIVIGGGSCGSMFMTVIGNNLHLDTGDSGKNCINAIVMSPYSGYIDDSTHLFGCARIMFKYGTKQCTMYKFLNCLFEGREDSGNYAYASRYVQGTCTGLICEWSGGSTYVLRRADACTFTLADKWSVNCSSTDYLPVSCTDGYASFDLVW